MIPNSQSVILELQTFGMQESARSFQLLLDKSPDEKLENHSHLIDVLKNGFIEAERAKQKRNDVDNIVDNIYIKLLYLFLY